MLFKRWEGERKQKEMYKVSPCQISRSQTHANELLPYQASCEQRALRTAEETVPQVKLNMEKRSVHYINILKVKHLKPWLSCPKATRSLKIWESLICLLAEIWISFNFWWIFSQSWWAGSPCGWKWQTWAESMSLLKRQQGCFKQH